ncbi:hypothetical protein H5410_045653 [Solanum commersonii]|uniref:Uncharacterized protein n=1 Tax=Solanum commersonii TaxID=4109 RepID=A0A9J5XA59_SOLCO|nr:hypothetical protein H5410_045653 [Solanum commersonii]
MSSSFFQEKVKVQRVLKRGSHTHKSSNHLFNRTDGENSRCHHIWFTLSSSHKVFTPKSNKTPHFR